MDNTHRIVQVRDHYEVYNSFDEFITSGDTYEECEQELIDMLVAEAKATIEIENREPVVA